MFMENQTRAWLNQNVSEETSRHLNIPLLVFTYLHCWPIYYSKALCMARLQAFSGTVFISALPRWNISETRLASVFTSRGLALEIGQSKDVRAGSYSWEIICKGHVLLPQLHLMFCSQHQVHSPVRSLNEANTCLLLRIHLCLFSTCKTAYWFLNVYFPSND